MYIYVCMYIYIYIDMYLFICIYIYTLVLWFFKRDVILGPRGTVSGIIRNIFVEHSGSRNDS